MGNSLDLGRGTEVGGGSSLGRSGRFWRVGVALSTPNTGLQLILRCVYTLEYENAPHGVPVSVVWVWSRTETEENARIAA